MKEEGGRKIVEEEPRAIGYFKDILVRKMGVPEPVTSKRSSLSEGMG